MQRGLRSASPQQRSYNGETTYGLGHPAARVQHGFLLTQIDIKVHALGDDVDPATPAPTLSHTDIHTAVHGIEGLPLHVTAGHFTA